MFWSNLKRQTSFSSVLFLTSAALALGQPIDVLTNRYDLPRTGSNIQETELTKQNVSGGKFGKLFEREVDGDIYAQPLIKTGVSVPGAGVRNVVYVATTNNSLYAFDVDSPSRPPSLYGVIRMKFLAIRCREKTLPICPRIKRI